MAGVAECKSLVFVLASSECLVLTLNLFQNSIHIATSLMCLVLICFLLNWLEREDGAEDLEQFEKNRHHYTAFI